jgi:hypothetical protein
MSDIALASLKHACDQQISWLRTHADELESGACHYLKPQKGITQDISNQIAEDFRHQANNLKAVMDAYARLLSKLA